MYKCKNRPKQYQNSTSWARADWMLFEGPTEASILSTRRSIESILSPPSPPPSQRPTHHLRSPWRERARALSLSLRPSHSPCQQEKRDARAEPRQAGHLRSRLNAHISSHDGASQLERGQRGSDGGDEQRKCHGVPRPRRSEHRGGGGGQRYNEPKRAARERRVHR